MAASFGKVGRPLEDRVARRREIYEAVAPLILEQGARRLSMRDAARAACISVGGLYHYFPTKRDLVLHGLDYDARNELCRIYRDRIADLAGWGLERYLEAYLDHSIMMFTFIRPSIQAALELGAEELQAGLDSGLAANVGELVESLRRVAPDAGPDQLEALARAIRRVVLGALVDRQADLGETRQQLRMLIEAYAKRPTPGTPGLERPASEREVAPMPAGEREVAPMPAGGVTHAYPPLTE